MPDNSGRTYLSQWEALAQGRQYAEEPASSLCVFHTPASALDLALHRRGTRWYLVCPRAYGMAASRFHASLNDPHASDPPETSSPASPPHLYHRFWFNSDAAAQDTLDGLLQADPPVLKLTGFSWQEANRATGTDADIEAKQVELLIGEEALCRRCYTCGDWETTPLDRRFYRVNKIGDEAVYWCGRCDRRVSLYERIRTLWAGSEVSDSEYFS